MEKIHNLKVKQGLLISGAALGALLTAVSCFAKSKENNCGLIGENDSSSISSDLELSNLTIEKHTDLSSDETSISKSSEHRDSSSKDDYIQTVTTGPVFTTYEGTLATTTKSVKHSNVDGSLNTNNTGSNSNSGTSVKQGGGGMHIASVDKTTKPVSTMVKLSTSTTKTIASTVSEPSTSVLQEMSLGTEFSDLVGADVPQTYSINDICDNADAFESYVYDLSNELRTNCDGTIYDSVDGSSMREQACAFMSLINYGNVSSDVLQKVYNDFGFDDFNKNVSILINYNSHLDLMHYKIDFTKYACDSCKHVGESLNEYQDAYERQDGSINDLIRSNFIDGKPCDDLKNQPARFFFMMNLSKPLFFDYYNFDNDYFTTVGLYSDYYNQFVDGMSHSK